MPMDYDTVVMKVKMTKTRNFFRANGGQDISLTREARLGHSDKKSKSDKVNHLAFDLDQIMKMSTLSSPRRLVAKLPMAVASASTVDVKVIGNAIASITLLQRRNSHRNNHHSDHRQLVHSIKMTKSDYQPPLRPRACICLNQLQLQLSDLPISS